MNPVRNSQSKKNPSKDFKLSRNQHEISNGVKKNGFTQHHFFEKGGIKGLLSTAKNGAGFTITELLVVVGIISLMSTLVLINFRLGERQFALEGSVHKLSQDLRVVQELSMSAKSHDCGVGWRMKGYGINLIVEADFYLLRARCEEKANPGNYSDSTIEEAIELEKGIKIKELERNGNQVSALSIFFYPPEPEIDFGGANKALVTLCSKTDINNFKSVSVNKIGLIAIE